MTRKVDVEAVDPLRRRLAVEVPAEEVSAELEKAYAGFARAAKVPGFRPGRVPRQVLERMFGDRIRAEVFSRLIQNSYSEVLAERHIPAVGEPEIVTEQAEPGASLRYSATVEVMPEIVVERYAGLEVERPLAAVTESDVDASIERLRQQFAQLHRLDGVAATEAGQVVTIDYEARVQGRLVGRGQGREVEIGASGFLPEFEQRLLGVEAGTELDIAVSYPAEHPAAEVAGQTVQFHVQVNGAFRKELPALDDEFAKDHGECETLAELRQKVRQRIEADAARQADEAVRRALVEQLVQRTEVPVPRALIERRTDTLVEEVLREWGQRRIKPQSETVVRARLRQELEPQARQQVKTDLLLDAIARQEGLSVSEEDLEGRVADLVAQSGSAAERVRAIYQDEVVRHQLRRRMLQSKAIEALAQRAKITTTDRSVAEARENG